MTNRVRAELEAEFDSKLADNTSQIITASDLRSACTDMNDTIFRDDAIALSDKTGRVLLQQGGYLLRDFTGAPYLTTGIALGGGTDYFTRTNWLPLDGGDMTLVLSKKHTTLPNPSFFYNGGNVGGNKFSFYTESGSGSNRRLKLSHLYDTSGVSIRGTANLASNDLDVSVFTVWHSFVFILRSAGSHEVWINGVDETLGSIIAGTIDFTGTAWFGEWFAGGNSIWADFSHIWLAQEYVDMSTEYSKFFDASNKPISLGANGSTPTGRQPEHFAPDGDLSNNLGTESNWTAVGSPVASSTSPTD